MDGLLQSLVNHGFSESDIIFPKSHSDVHVLNLRIPVLPRVIVRPRTTVLVSAAVRVANLFDLKVQARSGGHSFANHCFGGADGHLVVDLKHLDEFHVDPTTWKATVGPAVTLVELVKLLHNNGGRAVPHGVCQQ
jgi:FAD/FMN-containing dehydrogenase